MLSKQKLCCSLSAVFFLLPSRKDLKTGKFDIRSLIDRKYRYCRALLNILRRGSNFSDFDLDDILLFVDVLHTHMMN